MNECLSNALLSFVCSVRDQVPFTKITDNTSQPIFSGSQPYIVLITFLKKNDYIIQYGI